METGITHNDAACRFSLFVFICLHHRRYNSVPTLDIRRCVPRRKQNWLLNWYGSDTANKKRVGHARRLSDARPVLLEQQALGFYPLPPSIAVFIL